MTPETYEESPASAREEQEQQRKLKPYVKPRTRRVELRPQEAVLGNCKQDGVCVIGSISLGS
jgi:hypothetical protein